MDDREPRRRFDLTEQERAAVREVSARPPTAAELLRILAGKPRLGLELVRSGVRGAAHAVRADPALVWAIDSERVRSVVPDAAHGAAGQGAEPFMEALAPHLRKEDRALEIGCGGGRIGRLVAPRVARVTLSDVSEAVMAEARGALADLSNVDFVTTSGFTLEGIPDSAFDVAFGHDVFVQLDMNPTWALIDAARSKLKPGGILAGSFYTVDRPEWAAEQLEAVRRAAAIGRFGRSMPQPYSADQLRLLIEAAGYEVLDARLPEAGAPAGRHHVVVARARP